MTETRLIADLEKLIEGWEALAQEARQRADQRRKGDLSPAYLYGIAFQLETNAKAVRELLRKYGGKP